MPTRIFGFSSRPGPNTQSLRLRSAENRLTPSVHVQFCPNRAVPDFRRRPETAQQSKVFSCGPFVGSVVSLPIHRRGNFYLSGPLSPTGEISTAWTSEVLRLKAVAAISPELLIPPGMMLDQAEPGGNRVLRSTGALVGVCQ